MTIPPIIGNIAQPNENNISSQSTLSPLEEAQAQDNLAKAADVLEDFNRGKIGFSQVTQELKEFKTWFEANISEEMRAQKPDFDPLHPEGEEQIDEFVDYLRDLSTQIKNEIRSTSTDVQHQMQLLVLVFQCLQHIAEIESAHKRTLTGNQKAH